MRVTRRIFTQTAANFCLINFPEIFSFLRYFLLLFLILFFFCLFVCHFLKLKMYILIHIRLCWWVSVKKIFTWPISGNKTNFFWSKMDITRSLCKYFLGICLSLCLLIIINFANHHSSWAQEENWTYIRSSIYMLRG